MNYYAHSANSEGSFQDLSTHLKNVANLAAKNVAKWGAGEWGYAAGILHDLGKYSSKFQEYIKGRENRGGDHSSAGALRTFKKCAPLAFPIAGHHGGLQNKASLKSRLIKKSEDQKILDSLDTAQSYIPYLEEWECPTLPSFLQVKDGEEQNIKSEFFLRMLFSSLVDADFLDTEAHFAKGKSKRRGGYPDLEELWEYFKEDQNALINNTKDTELNDMRKDIYHQCLSASTKTQGVFTLTVPTGGGKTRSSMGFALKHGLTHGLDRVIAVIPYTSIIEQTADEYRKIFHLERAVLEHHSAIDYKESNKSDKRGRPWWELAAENWDAPIIITTTVQFFDSLFSNRPSKCRKLHNIAKSIVILDEAQTLPENLLKPIINVLRELVNHYNVSIVFSTATQPAFSSSTNLRVSVKSEEIMKDTKNLFSKLKRVSYHIKKGEQRNIPTYDWKEIANLMLQEQQAMTVVNTRDDARKLFRNLPSNSALHLSSSLCGAHRRKVLNKLKSKLDNGEPCHLATTQVVEAGVDIDFPLVLRALGPLDRIVQAGGRCNREGKLDRGQVIIFEPEDGGMPPGAYRSGADTAKMILQDLSPAQLHDPLTYHKYFQLLYQAVDTDSRDIQKLREQFKYADVDKLFRVIDDKSISVVIPWERGADILRKIRYMDEEELGRGILRLLQPYMVNVHPSQHEEAMQDGRCEEIKNGLWRWEGSYDSHLGLIPEGHESTDLLV